MINLQLQCNDPTVCLCPFSYQIKWVVLKGLKYDPWIVTIWEQDHQLELGTDQLKVFLVVSALVCLMTAFVVSILLLVDKHSSVEPTYQCLYFAIHCFLKDSINSSTRGFWGQTIFKETSLKLGIHFVASFKGSGWWK